MFIWEPTISTPILYFASDHAGFFLKGDLLKYGKKRGYDVVDLGTDSENSVDYPDYAQAVAQKLEGDPNAIGILICGTGIGMSIAANRFPWIRAAVCHENLKLTKLARAHNHANVLCLGARFIDSPHAKKVLETFLNTPFEDGRHTTRVTKLS